MVVAASTIVAWPSLSSAASSCVATSSFAREDSELASVGEYDASTGAEGGDSV
jgi:hypothetical protein